MKRFKNALLIGAVMVLMATASFAQDRKVNPEERAKRQTERLKTELALNEEQANAIEKINLEKAQKHESLREEAMAGRTEKRIQIKEINEEFDARMIEVLNEEQKAKYQTLKEERKAKMQERKEKGSRSKGDYHKKNGNKGRR